MATRNQ